MNRIILIGNGFDLAHGLKTSYKNFLDNYWQNRYKELRACKDCQLSDELYQFEVKNGDQLADGVELGHLLYLSILHYNTNMTWEEIVANKEIKIESFEVLSQFCDFVNEHRELEGSRNRIHHQAISQLFGEVNKAHLERWVDIENEYYKLLRKVCSGEKSDYEIVQKLNADLNKIKDKLIHYLIQVQNENITDELVNEQIKEKIFEQFNLQDISNKGAELFLEEIGFEVAELPGGMCPEEIEEEIRNHPEYSFMNSKEGAYRAMIKDMLSKGELKDFTFPNRILLLSFNYTNTAEKLYVKPDNRKDCELIYIHGELNNPNNPVIFGYGDEMDEHYKKIVDLNNNDYLQNIKSIHYLETDNYRNLLSFIESASYQIYIMGHSCGNSDRTLLNTIFEHKNCVSIKPYYYQKEDGSDDFIDKIQNISRNFKDMALMRDVVVNKRYCEPLPQNNRSI